LEAATEAFQTTLARYQKTYAIEKLTGNCLQKMLFEQQEQSQRTEDGFQQIREVTGLTAVMDIVHKFLHREVEQDLLKQSVREAEMKLQSLREARSGHPEETSLLAPAQKPSQPPGLQAEVQNKEWKLAKARRVNDDIKSSLHTDALLFEKLTQWTDRVRSIFSKDIETSLALSNENIPNYFEQLDTAVEKLIAKIRNEPAMYSKLNDLAVYKDSAEWKVVQEKDVVRFNCRVPANLDANFSNTNVQMQQQLKTEEERLELDVQTERERLKAASRFKGHSNAWHKGADDGARESAREARDTAQVNGPSASRTSASPSVSKAAGSGVAAVRAATTPRLTRGEM
jgi:hypothetical protein